MQYLKTFMSFCMKYFECVYIVLIYISFCFIPHRINCCSSNEHCLPNRPCSCYYFHNHLDLRRHLPRAKAAEGTGEERGAQKDKEVPLRAWKSGGNQSRHDGRGASRIVAL